MARRGEAAQNNFLKGLEGRFGDRFQTIFSRSIPSQKWAEFMGLVQQVFNRFAPINSIRDHQILAVAAQDRVRYVLVAPTTLKKFALGAGKGEKSVILREVFKDYGLNTATDDEADACVLAHIGACLVGREEPKNKPQREVLTTLTAEKKKPAKRFIMC